MRFLTLCLLLLFAASGAAIAGPLEDGLEAYKKGDFDTAVRLLRPLAEQGNPQAEEKLGRLYQRGKGVPKSGKPSLVQVKRLACTSRSSQPGRGLDFE